MSIHRVWVPTGMFDAYIRMGYTRAPDALQADGPADNVLVECDEAAHRAQNSPPEATQRFDKSLRYPSFRRVQVLESLGGDAMVAPLEHDGVEFGTVDTLYPDLRLAVEENAYDIAQAIRDLRHAALCLEGLLRDNGVP